MKIALIGYGKMGKAIEEIALAKGHEIVVKITSKNKEECTTENLKKADVAIEFTGPESAYKNIVQCLEANVAVISGSTGWTENLDKLKELCNKLKGTFLYASNFSVGVNLFFELNNYLAKLMHSHTDYNVFIEEIHHTQKKDAPSGTAITLAEQILQQNTTKKTWVNAISENQNELSIISKRIDPAPGTHKIKYTSAIDDIEIIHTAHNRKGFASGAVVAAEFIKNKVGIFTMKQVLGFE